MLEWELKEMVERNEEKQPTRNDCNSLRRSSVDPKRGPLLFINVLGKSADICKRFECLGTELLGKLYVF